MRAQRCVCCSVLPCNFFFFSWDFYTNTYCLDENFEEDKYKMEQNVEDFPEDAARWTGEKVSFVLFPSLAIGQSMDEC